MVQQLAHGDGAFSGVAYLGNERGKGIVERQQTHVIGFHNARKGAGGLGNRRQVVDRAGVDRSAVAESGFAIRTVENNIPVSGHQNLAAGESAFGKALSCKGIDTVGEPRPESLGHGSGKAQTGLLDIESRAQRSYTRHAHRQFSRNIDSAEYSLRGGTGAGRNVVVGHHQGRALLQGRFELQSLVWIDHERAHKLTAVVAGDGGKCIAVGSLVGEYCGNN